jgi:hypothetical protein
MIKMKSSYNLLVDGNGEVVVFPCSMRYVSAKAAAADVEALISTAASRNELDKLKIKISWEEDEIED